MTTGRRLTHQRLANWQIATFSEIVFRQYAMAYDRPCHEIPVEVQKSTGKNKLFPFLPQEVLADLFVNMEAHLFLPEDGHVPLKYLLVRDVTPDALCKLLDIGEKIWIH